MGRQCTVQDFSCLGNECNPFTKHTGMDEQVRVSVNYFKKNILFVFQFGLYFSCCQLCNYYRNYSHVKVVS